MDLAEVLSRPEGKRTEYKRDLSSPGPVLRTLVAFANTAGGTLVIGIEDGTRAVRGVDDPLAVEEKLANILADGISPRLVPEIDIVPWRSTQVLVVQVHLSSSRPHYLASAGSEAGVYVRIGSSNRRADPPLIAEMARSARLAAFDETPLPELAAGEVDVASASSALARTVSTRHLVSLGALIQHQGRLVPTIGGILLFGLDRLATLPDAWVQLGAFAGTDRSRILDQRDVVDPLPAWVDAAVTFVERHTTRGVVIDGPRRRDVPALPPVAVREAIVNAVVHADYSQPGGPLRIAVFTDRLEVENPGMLPFGLTVDDIRLGVSRVRNRVLARVFRELGYLEQWGSGIGRMSAACTDAGLPVPEFVELPGRFRVVLSTQRTGADVMLDDQDRRLLSALDDGRGHSTAELAAELGRSTRATRTRLAHLVQRGLVVEIGSGAHDPRRHYRRSRPG